MARTIAKDHGEKRGQILTAAARVFAEQGYDRASVSRIAEACRISKANIYHYYSSKDDILFDVLETYLRALRDRICGMDLSDQPPDARLRATISEILMAYQGADNEHRVQTNAIQYLGPEQQTVLRGYQRDLVTHVGDIAAAVAPDALGGDKAKQRAATMSIFGMLNWFYMWNPTADATDRADYADSVARIALGGLRAM